MFESDFEKENEYYKKVLLHPTIGKPERRYLKFRGITEETIKFWEIGYCPIGHKRYKKLKGRITYKIS